MSGSSVRRLLAAVWPLVAEARRARALLALTAVGGCHWAIDFEERVYVECEGSEVACEGNGTVACVDGRWSEPIACAGGASCSDGQCVDGCAGGVCVPAPPEGWEGPFVLYEGPNGMSAPACDPGYPTIIGDFFGELDGGSASCDCSCGPARGIVCSALLPVCYNASCFDPCSAGLNDPTQSLSPFAGCSVTTPYENAVHLGEPLPTNMGSCQPTDAESIPTPAFATAARVCGGAASTSDGCAASALCVPEAGADFARTCVAHSGDLLCLDPFYAVKHLLASGFEDSRSCSPCGCDTPESTCGGTVHFSSDDCNILIDQLPVGACVANPGGGLSINYAVSPSGTCASNGGELIGSVTEQGPITLCCDG